jgi:hypothetical protein
MAEKKGGNFTRDAQRKLETSNFSETVIKVAERKEFHYSDIMHYRFVLTGS